MLTVANMSYIYLYDVNISAKNTLVHLFILQKGKDIYKWL